MQSYNSANHAQQRPLAGATARREFTADSLLGEAMLLRTVVLTDRQVGRAPALAARWGTQAQGYLELAEKIPRQCRPSWKWDFRECRREVKDGGLWVVPGWWGINLETGKWSAGYEDRKATEPQLSNIS